MRTLESSPARMRQAGLARRLALLVLSVEASVGCSSSSSSSCPYTVVDSMTTVELTASQACDVSIGPMAFEGGPSASVCAQYCNGASYNACFLPGDFPSATVADGGRLVCGTSPDAGTSVPLTCQVTSTEGTYSPGCPIEGRRPRGLVPFERESRDVVGAYFAEAAHLEAASVLAFDNLARDLAHHRAPAHLVAKATDARADEVRHARVMARLARRYGGKPQKARAASRAVRPLVDIAIENACEGVVRETYGALVALYRAGHALEPEVRDALFGIAKDECEHADLSMLVAAWADAQLTPHERRQVEQARREALADLRVAVAQEPHVDLASAAGLPSAKMARALLDAMEREVLAA